MKDNYREVIVDNLDGTQSTCYVSLMDSGKEPGELCDVCRFWYPYSKMQKYGGKYFCFPRGCYKDIPGRIKSGR